ncbi:hypothetical protein NUW54_g6763 [Trametes sanguinea]|uniref:Uncharacterized protein n=1 Tax=Trametes sanguinea TaxID=158606 RepID=A0ACC1PRA7_9APHY|nr:hypothetical protein NUW54_g6763 [Trametes sanguinea]
MMGLFNQAAQKVYKPRGSSDEDKVPDDTEPDDTSILDENEGSIIASLISQLRFVPHSLGRASLRLI